MPKLPGMLLAALLAITALQNGLYRDQADGYGGKVIVTVTIRDGKLTKLTTENTGGEKSEYYLKAEEALTKEILEKQSIEGVDAVAGATGTSESILKAMEGIFEQARYDGTPRETVAPAPSDEPDSPANSVKEPTLTAWPHPTV
ncbi:MAG: FMN-binding protein [Clostridia bacterium]|nr:FMN-binding protein [Clostridia bacterium]